MRHGSARPSETQRREIPQEGLAGIAPRRAGHPEAHAAEDRAGGAVAAGPVGGVLPEHVQDQEQRQAGEGLEPLGREAEDEIDDIDRAEHRERDHEADRKLAPGAGVFEALAADEGLAPKMPADVGDEPEPIEARGRDLKQATPQDEPEEVAAIAREGDRRARGQRNLRRDRRDRDGDVHRQRLSLRQPGEPRMTQVTKPCRAPTYPAGGSPGTCRAASSSGSCRSRCAGFPRSSPRRPASTIWRCGPA